MADLPSSNLSPGAEEPRRAARLLWLGLVLVLAGAICAGAWTAFARKAPGGSAGVTGLSGSAGSGGALVAQGGLENGSPGARAGGPSDLPPGDEIPDFALTERSGRTVRRGDLRGKVWIANFIFTRCSSVCPDLTRRMADVRSKLAKRGAGDVLSVSFSVDPVYDTPKVLSDYADLFHADHSSWLFLSGEPKDVLHVVKDGFHLMMADPSEGAPVHSNRFVLVDARGRTRTSHLGTEDGVADRIVEEALALLGETRG